MLLPEPKRTISKGHKDVHLDFREALRSLKDIDRETYQKAITLLKPKDWQKMLAVLEKKKPQLYERISLLLKNVKEGRGDRNQIRKTALEMQSIYECKDGVIETPPKRTVIVKVKHAKVITGLPTDIIKQSNRLARDYGGFRKWTFGFDNRSFLVDLDSDALEELRKSPEVYEIEEPGEAHIMAGEIPTYNPSGINTDWGVARVPAAVPWAQNPHNYGAGVKVCVVDTGIGKLHQAFWKDGVTCYKGGWNFVGGNNNPEDDHDHGCLSPDGLIYTSLGIEHIESFWQRFVIGDETEIDISNLNISTISIDIGKPKTTTNVINKIFKIPVNDNVVIVTAQSGLKLNLTPWHPTFIFDGNKIVERRADELVEGDWLLTPATNNLIHNEKQVVDGTVIDEKIGYVIGAFLGDGHFRPAYKDSIGLTNTDPNIGRTFLDILRPYASSVGEYNYNHRVSSYLAYGKSLYQMMRNITELPEGTKKTYVIIIPLCITRSPISVISAFLAGYLDTDGHVSARSNTVNWSTVSKDMTDQMAFLLNLLGIRSRIYFCPDKRDNVVDCYQIAVTGIEEIRKLYEYIKPYLISDKRHSRILKIISKNIPWNVRNAGVPLSSESIDNLRKEALALGMNHQLKGGKDHRSAKGISKYRVFKLLDNLSSEKAIYLEKLISRFHFNRIVSIDRKIYDGYYYDLSVENNHNYIAGNFGATFIHNTYCCSIVAHQHNGITGSYKGIAPGVELYSCKVLDSKGSGSMANVAAGIDWCRTNGMDVCSMSLGGPAATSLETACNAAWAAGVLLSCAAGNSGPDDNTIGWPGGYEVCIAVGAIDYNEVVASWSSRGPQLDVSAPGVNITGALMGFTYADRAVSGSGNKYFTASGTSAACPHVSAAAALIKSRYPEYTVTQVRQAIHDNLKDI